MDALVQGIMILLTSRMEKYHHSNFYLRPDSIDDDLKGELRRTVAYQPAPTQRRDEACVVHFVPAELHFGVNVILLDGQYTNMPWTFSSASSNITAAKFIGRSDIDLTTDSAQVPLSEAMGLSSLRTISQLSRGALWGFDQANITSLRDHFLSCSLACDLKPANAISSLVVDRYINGTNLPVILGVSIAQFSTVDYSSINLGAAKKSILDWAEFKNVREIGRERQIKQIRSENVSQEQVVEFWREVAIIQGLRAHPNEITYPPSPLSLVIEFCEGGSLYDFLRKGTISSTQKLNFGKERNG
ncbi:hypothetical protein PROFUN_01540 [Planoprotostelium fungivorum]|uniref:Protein kinase domain-containing protein n=1 Tax=Planoprotostelium fungivorum TaxID=1890364 RepID=A0A2P6NTU1_9EUKA|nr:hypothetical protein PROFUN_01540 [Planoprotostelium fungivorum]